MAQDIGKVQLIAGDRQTPVTQTRTQVAVGMDDGGQAWLPWLGGNGAWQQMWYHKWWQQVAFCKVISEGPVGQRKCSDRQVELEKGRPEVAPQ